LPYPVLFSLAHLAIVICSAPLGECLQAFFGGKARIRKNVGRLYNGVLIVSRE